MKPRNGPTPLERLIQKVNQNGKLILDTPCWEWTGAKGEWGYGRFWYNGEMLHAHRVSWELLVGPIPEGKNALHNCDNPSCVNPAHLYIGTDKENSQDCVERGRLRNCGNRVPVETRRKIQELYRAGVPSIQIARQLGIGFKTVRKWASRDTTDNGPRKRGKGRPKPDTLYPADIEAAKRALISSHDSAKEGK